jgi:hypothetical protein
MTRKIKVRVLGTREVREVTIQEAEKILEETYNDPVGGLVADAGTGEVIYKIGPNIEQIVIMEQMLGGG